MAGPAETREPRRFEPPPWEREQFEELDKGHEEEALAREEAREETAAPAPSRPPM